MTFFHKHPYQPFIQENTTKLIVGTLPPPRFSIGDLLEKDVDFCYGSYYNSLWLFIDKIHNLNLRYDNSEEAILERKQFLIQHKIGVCDIVASAEREKIDASDLGMKNIILRDILGYLEEFPSIDTLLFTGGNSKNGPEYFFRKHLKTYNLKLEVLSNEVPRIHQFNMNSETTERIIRTVSLTSGSGAANISISRLPLYKQLKARNPDFNTFDFRVMQYREFI
ncbi:MULTISPECIES: uracil-DNA glycosylase family protein [Bizionia]|uniref:Uracil-DNA glycosylase family protein n=1 Tax=Bizionia algoritergicola TaxID=291187 RepID=A0A5D0QWJ1_9FLAO|nr:MULTISPECIES: uracil-DNA glycosylase family protein [Bizionia]OBX21506.1 DNA glycosylase [Bizionia sp. APA-3]TYB72838.1 uracil-DNA glycosylase family protein [Bizionia algoritergicola]